MKQKSNRDLSAFTLLEVIVIIVIIALLALVFLPTRHRRSSNFAVRISCVNNLKEIGTAYHLWAGDNGDLVPSQQTVASNGWREFLTNANQGTICWTNYVIMQNELGQSPKLLICPSDERLPAQDFTNKFDNSNISYFVGVSANVNQFLSIQGGDRNLGPGIVPTNDYGYSPRTGKGNDVAIPTNSSKGPVLWSLKMHSMDIAKSSDGAGNILFGDGSAQQVSTASFNQQWLPNADPTTTWPAGHIPATPSIRLVFP
jgi:prepilin-type processing-associated H-X9-DG protein